MQHTAVWDQRMNGGSGTASQGAKLYDGVEEQKGMEDGSYKIHRKRDKINENQRKINENLWKSKKK